MDIVLRRATVDDLDRCAVVLGDAFAEYPWTQWTVDGRDHVQRIEALQRLALQRLGLPFGQVWVAQVDGTVHSVAAWMDSAVRIPDEVHAAMQELSAGLQGSRHDASNAAELLTSAWRPTERHVALEVVGTTRAMQRQGLASRVLEPTLAELDADGVVGCLETSSMSNVGFYTKLGFEVTNHTRISGGGPEVWAMTRAPSTH